MKRDIYRQLLSWKKSIYRKPLVLRGARQVGKTYILNEFAKEYRNHVYLNFEENPPLRNLFQGNKSPQNLVNSLEVYFNIDIKPGETLLFFDEVQECPDALNSLKYFDEHANEYHVVTAGSLLGIKLNKKGGFPVGKVDFLDLKPLSFLEFLDAVGQTRLRQMLVNLERCEQINTLFHKQLIDLLKKYFVIGGMPEAVNIFVAENDFGLVRNVQRNILDAYLLDFAKHVSAVELPKITRIWESIPSQLAKENRKFVLSHIRKNARMREYRDAIQWLLDAGLVSTSIRVALPKLPLNSYIDDNFFKLYMLDVGLLGALSRLSPKVITQGSDLFTEFKGSLTENYVAQELLANVVDQLYYWSSSGSAEVDFLLLHDSAVLPLEVKAGLSTRAKSLKIYIDKYNSDIALRTNLLNFKQNGVYHNIPLYAVSQLLRHI